MELNYPLVLKPHVVANRSDDLLSTNNFGNWSEMVNQPVPCADRGHQNVWPSRECNWLIEVDVAVDIKHG